MRTLYTLGAGGATKSISLTDAQLWKDTLNWDIGTDEQISAPTAYTAVGWVARCVHVRATALMTLPWALVNERNSEEIANSEDDTDAPFDWLERLPEMLYLSEAALCIYATAYWHKVRTRRTITDLRWFQPDSMEPVWTPTGLQGFRRQVNGMIIPSLPVDDVVHIRLPNPLHETEHATSPVQTALLDAQVIHNQNQFASMFFKRGAIKATLLTVDGNPLPQEKERLKSWWSRAFSGLSNAFNTEIVSAAVHPVVVGEGISELNNAELTTEKREAIATALGIPHSLVMSNAANYATADADRLNFYDTTIIPESGWIVNQLNRQLFRPLGYRLQFKPKQLAIYQEDEEQRAQAFSAYVAAGMRPSIAAQMLGMTLPDGVEYADLDETFDRPAPTPVIVQQPTGNDAPAGEDAAEEDDEDPPVEDGEEDTDSEAKRVEIERFRRWLKRRPNADIHKFASTVLTHDDLHAVADKVRVEVAPAESFFTLPSGSITREWWTATKALILQLDPVDDEAEQKLRMELEKRTERELRRALRDMMHTLYPEGWDTDNPQLEQSRIHDAFLHDQRLRDTVSRAIQDGADLGVNMAIDTLESGVGIAFDYTLAHEAARAWVLRYTDDLLNQLGTTSGRLTGQAVARWFENGESLDALIGDLTPIFGQRRAKLIASTEVTRAASAGTREAYRVSGVVTELVWQVARGEKVCPYCSALHGKVVGIDASFSDALPEDLRSRIGRFELPPAHPACILPGNLVNAPGGIDAMAKSFYVGRCIEITLSDGSSFTVTQNHPILTPSGWIAAQFLDKGMNVLCAMSGKWTTTAIDPNDQNMPAAIEKVFDAFVESGQVISVSVPPATEDLHGEGEFIQGNINIVYANRFLQSNGVAQGIKTLGENVFGFNGERQGFFFGLSDFRQFVNADFSTFRSGMGAREHSNFTRVAGICPACNHPLGSIAGSNTGFYQTSPKNISIDTQFGTEGLFGFTGEVTGDVGIDSIDGLADTPQRNAMLFDSADNNLDADAQAVGKFISRFASEIALNQIVAIRNFDFSGHVYDLQSDMYQLYICNGVIVKNCRCWVTPQVREVNEVANGR